ncbi:MAG: SDR family NAD(P)-dependent oxidoreductase [Sporomusaceae bacterium]|jgi:short-subunit dehydrogenase|nr:SDR family NAD(P)-dependent oxidoreductase [Sporomusaceae bacterium]
MKKAIILGASSGIGRQLAKIMAKDGSMLGLTARRIELLQSLKTEMPAETHLKYMDIANTDESINALNELIKEMGGVDLIIISAGVGHLNTDLKWSLEQETINTNVSGVTAMINASMQYFLKNGTGHLAVISSVAALRGSAQCPAYNASKAYISNYLEGIRCKVKKEDLPITITDIKPGLVNTAMAKGGGLFWVMPLDKAAWQIYQAIKKRKNEVYITKRWGLIAFILKFIPQYLYYRI